MENPAANQQYQESVRQVFDYLYTTDRFNGFYDLLKNKKWDQIDQHEIYKSISAFLEEKKHTATVPSDTILFRARKIDSPLSENKGFSISNQQVAIDQIILSGYNESNSKEPPIGISMSGRANPAYSSYFYAAEDLYTACSEIKTVQRELISVAQFMTQRNLNMIDLFSYAKTNETYSIGKNVISYDTLFLMIAMAFSRPKYNEDDYYLTQYIADLIRKYGYDGIVYRSFFSNKRNYVIFNCAPNSVRFLNSEIVLNYSQINTFVAFNTLETVTVESIEPDKKAKQEMKQRLVLALENEKSKNGGIQTNE